MYETMSFKEFDEHFIQKPDGFLPVYFSIDHPNYYEYEDEDEKPNQLTLVLDMACLSRLNDGKVKFLNVEFDSTIENQSKIIMYLETTQKLINESLDRNMKNLKESIVKEII